MGESTMQATVGPDGTVVITGRLDATQCAAAEAVLSRMKGTVTIDCAGLDYIASAGLGLLLKTHKRLVGEGGGIRLRGASRSLRELLSFSGFDQVFEIEPAS